MDKLVLKNELLQRLSLLRNNSLTLQEFFQYNLDVPITNKILIVQFRAIGDAYLLSGFIREIKLNNLDKDIVIICDYNNYPVFEHCPYTSEVIPLKYRENLYDSIEDFINICYSKFWNYKFELAFCVQIGRNNLFNMLCANLVGAQTKVGFGANVQQMYLGNIAPTEFDFLLDNNVLHPSNMYNDNDRKMFLLKSLNYKISSDKLESWLSDDDINNARYLINHKYINIIIGLGGRQNKKKYSPNLLLEVLKEIQDDKTQFILVGSAEDIESANYLMDNIKCINLVSLLSIRQTCAIISLSDIYIGNDTATLHMASIYHLSIIGLYMEAKDKMNDNPGLLSSIKRFAPKNIKILQPERALYPCNNVHCHGGCDSHTAHCINQINPSKIAEAYKEVKKCINLKKKKY